MTEVKYPKMELFYILKNAEAAKDKSALKDQLIDDCNVQYYTKLAKKGLFEYNKEEVALMENNIKKEIDELEKQAAKECSNQSIVNELHFKMLSVYSRAMNNEGYERIIHWFRTVEITSQQELELKLCVLRWCLITEDYKMVEPTVDIIQEIYEQGCGWDLKNKIKVYIGIYYLISNDFKRSSMHFIDSLGAFESSECIDYNHTVLYGVFGALISYNRADLKKLFENSDVLKCKEMLEFGFCLLDCDYSNFLLKLNGFVTLFENDPFLSPLKNYFIDEMLIKGFSQLLKSYQSLHLTEMANIFNCDVEYIESNLREFVFADRLSLVIDKVEGIVQIIDRGSVYEEMEVVRMGDEMIKSLQKIPPKLKDG